jgi:malonate-semialdehyde dehydrogenase (acetylating) / methylmalonate-semialdehyde dehydrogenase
MITTICHWVDGAPFEGTPGQSAEITNPATGAVTGRLALPTQSDAHHVISRAAAAAPGWAATSVTRRTQVMFASRELLNARKDELAAIITAEHGSSSEGTRSD